MSDNLEILPQYIETKKTARYVTFGQLSERTKYFWFVIHGSRMRCEQMIYKFAEFDPLEHFIIAPEALHRHYLKGFGGDVVASWMTKRDRLYEIEDIASYLSLLYNQFAPQLPEECAKTVLGFSQGGTMMFRWLHHTPVNFDYSIMYSGWVPEEIDLRESKTDLSTLPKIFTYGLQDQFINEETISKIEGVINKNELDFTFEKYEGDHRVDKKQLRHLFEKYIKK